MANTMANVDKVSLAQDDFECLGIACRDVSGEPTLDEESLPTFSGQKRSSTGDEKYVPVNFIPDSVYAMINAWQEAHSMHDHTCEMDMNVEQPASAEGAHHNQEIYEPVRPLTVVAAPKKFYRTFWRSAARRMIQREKEYGSAMMRTEPS